MSKIPQNLQTIGAEIAQYSERYHRPAHSVRLLAVSKRHPADAIREAYDCGQRAFGENYAQEMLEKAEELSALEIEWHFIGPLQSNKTKDVAATAHWVHAIDRLKIARRLSEQRPSDLPALKVCLQVNVNDEASKSGVSVAELPELAAQVSELPGIKLRGLMAIPEATHVVHFCPSKGVAFRRALNFDEMTTRIHNHIHIRFGIGIFRVVQIQYWRAIENTHRNRGQLGMYTH